MIYDAMWYAQNAGVVLVFLEFLKEFGGHYLRDKYAFLKRYYAFGIKALALAFAMFIAFGAKADLLLAIDVVNVHPYVGYALSGVVFLAGDTAYDKVYDNRKMLKLVIDVLIESFKSKAVERG